MCKIKVISLVKIADFFFFFFKESIVSHRPKIEATSVIFA